MNGFEANGEIGHDGHGYGARKRARSGCAAGGATIRTLYGRGARRRDALACMRALHAAIVVRGQRRAASGAASADINRR
ncbi:hypothetical protein BURMUCF2_0451 [Burkholderia multivorans CF2]|nr:hypothetical protein BURMUCF2_0451 [Burkholderia multivorans CF2]